MSQTHEGDPRSNSGIMPFQIDASNLPNVEAHVASAMDFDSVVVSPNSWVIDPAIERPDDRVALGGIHRIVNFVINSDPLYEGSFATTFGSAEEPDAMAIVSPTLSRRDLEATRNEVVGKVNGLLAKLQSPHRL